MRRFFAVLLTLLAVGGLVACNPHGKKLTFKKGEVFYKPPVTKAEATKLGNFLVEQKYFNDSTRKSVQLLKVGSAYQVRLVVKKSILDMPAALMGLKAMGSLASGAVFAGAPVEMHLCDKKLKSFKTLGPFKSYGAKVVLNRGEVFYRKPVTKAEAEKLAGLLQKEGYLDGNPKSVQMVRKGELTQLRFVIKKGVENKPELVAVFKRLGAMIQRALYAKGNVEVHLCDAAFSTIKVVR